MPNRYYDRGTRQGGGSRGSRGPPQNQYPDSNITDEVTQNIDLILSYTKENIPTFIHLADKFGEHLSRKAKLTISQIRKIYSEVQRIKSLDEEKSVMRLHMLRPKLAYAKGRHRAVTDLQKVLDTMIEKIKTEEQLTHFKEFFEAVLAYHRAYGGKE